MSEFRILACKVSPNAKKSECLGWEADVQGRKVLRIRLAAAPKEGEANRELVTYLARLLKLPKSQVRLVQGEASRTKRVEIPEHAWEHLPLDEP